MLILTYFFSGSRPSSFSFLRFYTLRAAFLVFPSSSSRMFITFLDIVWYYYFMAFAFCLSCYAVSLMFLNFSCSLYFSISSCSFLTICFSWKPYNHFLCLSTIDGSFLIGFSSTVFFLNGNRPNASGGTTLAQNGLGPCAVLLSPGRLHNITPL